jgi:ribosomal protein S18 acetylase RimI-like enzyme
VGFQIRPAREADLDGAACTLAAAFDSYAWTRWAIPADGYQDRLKKLQRLYLCYALVEGIVLISDDLRGVIALLPPEASPPGADFQDQVARLHGRRLTALAHAGTPSPPEGVWTLATVGVHPAVQGQGLGGAIIRAGLAAVHDAQPQEDAHPREVAGVALETSDERNVRLYQRAGFNVTATTLVEDGPTVYSMLRAASA